MESSHISHAGSDWRNALIRQGMREKAAAGIPQSRVPTGFDRCYKFKDTSVLPSDPTWLSCMRQAFLLVNEGSSLRKALVKVEAMGLRMPNGRPPSAGTFWRHLSNPFYCGYIRYEGRLIRGNFEPVISDELFQSVQQKLMSKRKIRQNKNERLPD